MQVNQFKLKNNNNEGHCNNFIPITFKSLSMKDDEKIIK